MIKNTNFSSTQIVGVRSAFPVSGKKMEFTQMENQVHAMQSGTPTTGSMLAVNGGMNPTSVYPVASPAQTCNKQFWTSKQAYHHEVFGSDEIVGDSSLYLLKMDPSGSVLDSIDMEPVLYSIINNMMTRTTTGERVAVASWWVNSYWWDKASVWDPAVTTASPAVSAIPRSSSVEKITYVSGSRTAASSYLKPASYAGPLGPVWPGVTSTSDTPRSWYNTFGPVEPSNIQIRDIKLDAHDNLWCILQVGWEYCKTYQNKQSAQYYNQEQSTWIGYDYSGSGINQAYFYNQSSFPRLFNPSGVSTRAGPIRPRVFIVVFDATTNYKTWDYVPFRPGTRGFNGVPRDSSSYGPALYGITVPPSRLDADPYGNIYFSVGTADMWEGFPASGILHCYGIAKNEQGYLYVRPAVNKAYTVSIGLDVGRIGPYPSQCVFMAYDQNTMAYYNHSIGSTSGPAFRAPQTWMIGGDGISVTKWKEKNTSGVETWYANTFGNYSSFRSIFLLDTTLAFPHPYVITPTYFGPCEVRCADNEWFTSTALLEYQNRDTDLLFAACDYLRRNYQYQASPSTYNCASWWRHETTWTPALTSFAQIHPHKDIWFEIGAGELAPVTGWLPAEAPGFWYLHHNIKNNIQYEMGCRSYAFTDTRGVLNKGFLPLNGGITQTQDTFYRVASTPYSQAVTATDFFEKHAVMGMFPSCKARTEFEDFLVLPVYDWKHEVIAFTAQTWDSYNAIRSINSTYTTGINWPYRWHSYKKTIEGASWDEIDAGHYGAKSSYLDPASLVLAGDKYTPADADKVFYYDDTFQAMLADVQSKWDRAEVRTAYQGMFPYIAQAKWHYFNSGLTDLNYGSFASALSCDDVVGFMIPRYKIGATFYDDPDTGDYYINIITDTRPLKRLFLVTVNKDESDIVWVYKESTTKGYWEKTTSWASSSQPNETIPPILSVKSYDLNGGEIAGMKSWEVASTVERYQQLCFVKLFNDRRSPQYYL